MSKKRLYIDIVPICRPFRSGVGYSLTELIKAVDAHKPTHEQYDVVAFAPFDILPLAKELGLTNITLKALPVPFKIMQALYKLAILPPIDWWLGAGIYLFYDFRRWPLTKKSKSLVCVHDLTYKKYPEFCEPKNLRFLQRFVPKSVAKADRVITVSQAMRQEIIDELGVPTQKIGVVYPIADERFVRKDNQQIATTLQKYGLPTESYVLVIGNQEPRKNVAVLLAAMQKLGSPADVPPLVLFGGMSWNSQDLQAEESTMQKAGYIIARPSKYVEDQDMPALISGALCVVTPSIYEGFSFPPLQSVLCQTPCIAAEGLPVAEVVGQYLIQVPAKDVDQLAAALHNRVQDGREAMPVDRAAIFAKVGASAVAAQLLSEVLTVEG